MRNNIITLLIVALITISCSEKIDYNEEEIFSKHISAISNGNVNLLEQITPRKLTYKIFFDDSQVGSMETLISSEFEITQKIDIKDGPKIIKKLTEENGGYLISNDKKRDLKEGEILMLKLTAAYSDLLGYRNAGRAFKVEDIETVNGEPCYVIEIKTESGEKACEIYLSQTSYLILKRVEKQTEVFYEDYQLKNNIYIPHRVKIKSSQTVRFRLDSVEFLNT